MIPHGEYTKYSNDHCRCVPCTAAHAAYITEMKWQRRTRADAQIPHGYGGYTNWMCRCDVCRAAKREHNRAYMARKRAERKGVAA